MIYVVQRKIGDYDFQFDEDRIEAISFRDAEMKLKSKNIPDSFILGRLISEIPNVNGIPDYKREINYRLQELN